jgi:hypothetical protein
MMAKPRSLRPERRSEDIVIPDEEPRNWILIDDATLDSLAHGICPEALAERMWRLQGLDREFERSAAQERAEARRREEQTA